VLVYGEQHVWPPQPPGAESLRVLGPPRVGKSTLVEHVLCYDERVRSHFSTIILCSGDLVLQKAVVCPRSKATDPQFMEQTGPRWKNIVINQIVALIFVLITWGGPPEHFSSRIIPIFMFCMTLDQRTVFS
jgi:hypothetical protein